MSSRTHAKIRVGAVNYLNTKPLIYRLNELGILAAVLREMGDNVGAHD